jgi:hypothetical protein
VSENVRELGGCLIVSGLARRWSHELAPTLSGFRVPPAEAPGAAGAPTGWVRLGPELHPRYRPRLAGTALLVWVLIRRLGVARRWALTRGRPAGHLPGRDRRRSGGLPGEPGTALVAGVGAPD